MPARPFKREQKALLVHPDLNVLTNLQSELSQQGFVCILARDLPTALLAMTQHYFEVGLVAAQVTEQGDGWSLSGVFRMVFPKSFVAVLGVDTGIRTLQSAINNGINEVYEAAKRRARSWIRCCTNCPPSSPCSAAKRPKACNRERNREVPVRDQRPARSDVDLRPSGRCVPQKMAKRRRKYGVASYWQPAACIYQGGTQLGADPGPTS